jgi:hypothetical protein
VPVGGVKPANSAADRAALDLLPTGVGGAPLQPPAGRQNGSQFLGRPEEQYDSGPTGRRRKRHLRSAFIEPVYSAPRMEPGNGKGMPPPEMAQALQDEQQLMDNITYLDLHQPWLVSPAR